MCTELGVQLVQGQEVKRLPNVSVKGRQHDARTAQQIILHHELKHTLYIAFMCLFGPGNLYLHSLLQQIYDDAMGHACSSEFLIGCHCLCWLKDDLIQ